MAPQPPKPKKKYARYAEELPIQNKQPIKRTITSTGEDITTLSEKEIEEKLAINKAVEKADFQEKVKKAIEERKSSAGISPELQDLQTKQTEELQNLDIPPENPPMSLRERQAAAGVGIGNALAGMIPGLDKRNKPDPTQTALNAGFIGQSVYQAVGAVGTLGVGEYRISSLFAPNRGTITDLKGDIAADVTASNQVLRDAGTRGGNILQAIETQEKIEESIRAKYLQTMNTIRESPTDIINGMDIASEMKRDLIKVINNKQALQRYLITKDKNELLELSQNLNIGGMTATE